MADIELTIKIPQKWFDDIVREKFTEIDELCALIQHGIPLPKGHGKLIDADELPRDIEWDDIEKALAIIEANKEDE